MRQQIKMNLADLVKIYIRQQASPTLIALPPQFYSEVEQLLLALKEGNKADFERAKTFATAIFRMRQERILKEYLANMLSGRQPEVANMTPEEREWLESVKNATENFRAKTLHRITSIGAQQVRDLPVALVCVSQPVDSFSDDGNYEWAELPAGVFALLPESTAKKLASQGKAVLL